MDAPIHDDSRVRDLFNALRTGDLGVGSERFLGAFYRLQHAAFSVLDARDAFVSSTAASERYLSYRDFQYALLKTARLVAGPESKASDSEVLAQLLDAVQRPTPDLDAVQRQLTQLSVLAVLDQHMRQLIQSFQLYGTANELTPRRQHPAPYDTTVPMTLDGFVDFLNAYFEYEEYFSYDTIEELAMLVVSGSRPITLHFAHFLELFCRVASSFHVVTLEREGAQLRKAVESSRLEFSLQLLFEKMDIHVLKDRDEPPSPRKQDTVRTAVLPEYDIGDAAIDALTLDDEGDKTPDVVATNAPSMRALLSEIEALLGSSATSSSLPLPHTQPQRPQSRLFARLPPRKSPAPSRPVWLEDPADGNEPPPWDPPAVTLIREIVAPPPLPPHILKRLEHAITYQNTGQFHMARGALHQCRTLYRSSSDSITTETEARVFFSLMDASVSDSARQDARALAMYVDALRAAERLSPTHPGRALVQSCLGCMLYFVGELALAKRCHSLVLDARRASCGDDHVDTATAMNNLACCLSQDPQGSAIEEAYLYLKTAKRIYSEQCGPGHARVETVARNFERVLASQRTVVVDPVGAVARGEYAHVIPGSRFQIKALVLVKNEKGISGKKKKKKKGGKKKK